MSGHHLTQPECDRIKRLCEVHSGLTVCEIVGISTSTLHQLKSRGYRSATRSPRPIPDDWQQVAPLRSAEWLRKHYRTSARLVASWLHQHPVARPKDGPIPLPMPADFPAVALAPGMTLARAAEQFGVCRETAGRWLRQHRAAQRAHRSPGWVERYVADHRAHTAV